MVKAYARLGILHVLIKEVVKVVFSKKPLKSAYPGVAKAIAPILKKQYTPMLELLISKYEDMELEHWKNDTVYSCWMQGYDKAPLLVQKCLNSHQKYIKDKKFVLITEDNQHEYVTLPDYIEEKRKRGIIPYAVYTDLVRLELLIKYGGSWIDSTVLCTNGNYPKEMLDCNLFLYQFKANKRQKSSGFSTWFISAYSNNKVLLIARDLLYKYWKDYDCLIDYFVFHKFLWMIKEKLPVEFDAMPEYSSYDALRMVFALERKYDEKLMREFLNNSSFHKLDYRKSKQVTNGGDKTFYAHLMETYTNQR